MVNLLPTIRLAQSIWKCKFPSVDKPLKKGLWNIYAPGLIFRTLPYLPFLFNFGQNKLKPSQQNKTLILAGFFLFSVEFLLIGRGWGGGENELTIDLKFIRLLLISQVPRFIIKEHTLESSLPLLLDDNYFWNNLPFSIYPRPTKKLFKNSLFSHYLYQY